MKFNIKQALSKLDLNKMRDEVELCNMVIAEKGDISGFEQLLKHCGAKGDYRAPTDTLIMVNRLLECIDMGIEVELTSDVELHIFKGVFFLYQKTEVSTKTRKKAPSEK